MKIKSVFPLLPSSFLILAVSGIALTKTFLGSIGLWNDAGRNRGSLSSFTAISKSARSALILSVELATMSTILAAVLGLVIAYLIHMAKGFSRTLAIVTGLIVITPHLVAAASFNLLLGDAGFLSRVFRFFSPPWPQFVAGPLWLAVIFDFAWKESAFIALVLVASLPLQTQEMRNVASTLGAKPLRVATKVLLPSVKPALIISSGLAFVYSIGSYEATWMLGRTYPEPLANMTFRLFSNSDLSLRPQAYASAVLSIVLIGLAATTIIFSIQRGVKT